MDGPTLSKAMGGTLSAARYAALAPAFTKALAQANCTTVNRAAMFCAQVAHESAGLKWMEELASGSAYEGRSDLGNTHKGDGVRFKGRGPIQVTGRHNYTACSAWAFGKGYVPTKTYFVDNPAKLASDQYGFIGVVWYWIVARNMNAFADKKDIRGATLAVNGGTRGLAERTAAWNRCLKVGKALLAGSTTVKAAATVSKTTAVNPTAGQIHTKYGQKGTMWAKGWHQGDDWHRNAGAAEVGDPIVAVADGKVIYAGAGGGWGPAFGNHVLVTWSQKRSGEAAARTVLDAHMSKLAVKAGQTVKAGQVIGYKGATGNVSGPHDHHEQHIGTGYYDKVVKPVYPGKTTTTTTTTPAKKKEGVPVMATPQKWRNAKPVKYKKGSGWHMVPLEGGAYSLATGPGTVYATVDITVSAPVRAQFRTVNKSKAGKVVNSSVYDTIHLTPGGNNLVFYDKIGGPGKGYTHKYVRLYVYADHDVTISKSRTRAGKEA